jgi:hypothetical protein
LAPGFKCVPSCVRVVLKIMDEFNITCSISYTQCILYTVALTVLQPILFLQILMQTLLMAQKF